jgi:arylsulfatase
MRALHRVGAVLAALLAAAPLAAQDGGWPQPSTPSVLPRPDFRFPGSVGRTIEDSDPPQFPQPTQAPAGAPNVVLILLDDVGYGQFATFGGGVASPTMDALAAEGLRFTRFHTTALCSPTRAALITGRNHHSAASGVIGEAATGYDGYTSIIPKGAGTIAEVLGQNGYMTAWIGKNHNTPAWETSAAGPFDRWANGHGFDYFYGFNAGDMNHYDPVLWENRNLVPASDDPDYYMTTDFADRAIAWVRRVKAIAPDRPFFLYVAPGATHSPHQVPAEWIEPFEGQFDAGWDAYREATLARQKALGVVPENTDLTARSAGLPAWDGLDPDAQRLYARMMEVFAGFGANVDHEMGRIVDAVKALPEAENTIFIYIAGDNGSSAEGGLEGSTNENLFFNGFPETWQENIKVIDELGGPRHFNHFPSSWAHAMNTPFQWTKQVASHFGGTRNPMIIAWPGRITDAGGVRTQFTHTIDIVPTLYEVIGVTPPEMLNGVPQKPIEGISFAASLVDPAAPEHRSKQYFELLGNRGVYQDGWMASAPAAAPWIPIRPPYDPDAQVWELYNVAEDFSQAHDLAAENPEKLRQLQDLWWAEAARYDVLPLDGRGVERLNAEAMGRPALTGDATTFTYFPGQLGLPNDAAPRILNKSWTLTAEIDVPEGGAEGMIVTHGGLVGGYGLYLRDGRPTFVYNYLALDRPTIAAPDPLPPGRATVEVDFAYHGAAGEVGKGATVTLKVDGAEVAKGEIEKTIPIQISLGEGLDVAMDVGSAVDFTYSPPFAFTGGIEKVTVALR